MDSALLHSSSKRVRNPKRSTQTRPYVPSRSNSANLSFESSPKMEMFINGGVLLNPPFSLSSSLPRMNSSPCPVQSRQPPLLPLPIAPPPRQFRSLPVAGAGGSLSPTHKKHNKGNYKDQTNGKKPKSPLKVTTVKGSSRQNPDAKPGQVAAVKANGVRLGPDPASLPDLATVVFFPLPPPPSSLPMPRFPMRPKLSCGVEAAAGGGVRVDTGATDGLCRLLNLR